MPDSLTSLLTKRVRSLGVLLNVCGFNDLVFYESPTPVSRGIIPSRVDINMRPAVVDDKTRLGDWEADTVIGKGHQGVLVTLTERVSKLNLVIPIVRKEAELTKEAIIQALTPFADWVHTHMRQLKDYAPPNSPNLAINRITSVGSV